MWYWIARIGFEISSMALRNDDRGMVFRLRNNCFGKIQSGSIVADAGKIAMDPMATESEQRWAKTILESTCIGIIA